jgi:shikimate kinase
MQRIVLIGGRGAGKSTVGALLADRLGWAFADTDAVLEARLGTSITAIFIVAGESAFRDEETATLTAVLRADSIVIAAGGGIVVRESNRTLLANEFVVWLDVSPEVAFARVSHDPTTESRRPRLTALPGPAEMAAILEARRELYSEVATLTLPATDSPSSIVDRIVMVWNARNEA